VKSETASVGYVKVDALSNMHPITATVSCAPAVGLTVVKFRDTDPIESMISNPKVRAFVVPCPAFPMLCFNWVMDDCREEGK
jgi:hypothetical protein